MDKSDASRQAEAVGEARLRRKAGNMADGSERSARSRARSRTRRIGRGRSATFAGLGLAFLGACGTPPLTLAEFEARSGVAAPVQPDPEAVESAVGGELSPEARAMAERLQGIAGGATGTGGSPAGTGGGTPSPEISVSWATGAQVAQLGLDVNGGGERRLIEVVLYDGYGIVGTVDPPTGNLDRAVVRNTGIEPNGSLPDTFLGDPVDESFTVADVAWDVIPSLVAQTPGALGVDGGIVSHVLVESNKPFTNDLVIRVYVTGPRGGGRIDHFADGRPMRAFKD